MSSQKIVFITGADKDLGFETAKDLICSSDIYHVLIGSRDTQNGRQAVQALRALPDVKGTVETIMIDVTDDASIQAAAGLVEHQYSRLDCLINNSGISSRHKNPAVRIREDLAVNTVGPVVITDAFLHLLKASPDPRLIFVTSSLGSLQESSDPSSIYYATDPIFPFDYYRASKAALHMILIELHKREGNKIKMWGADPGWLATDLDGLKMIRQLEAPYPPGGAEQIARCVKGERDADVGKVVVKDGIVKW